MHEWLYANVEVKWKGLHVIICVKKSLKIQTYWSQILFISTTHKETRPRNRGGIMMEFFSFIM